MRSGEPRPEKPDPRPTINVVSGGVRSKHGGSAPRNGVLTHETSSSEHADVHREALKDAGNNNNQATEENGPFPPAVIGTVWCQYKT